MPIITVRKTLARAYSEISKSEVLVIENGHRRTLGVSRYNYSIWSADEDDLFMDRYWGKAVAKTTTLCKQVERVLILGLGAGSVAYLLNHYFHPIIIDGIEIDPVIIDLGKRFFYLNSLPNLHIFTADAGSWVTQKVQEIHYQEELKYDIIFMDIFTVDETPSTCDSVFFFSQVAKLLKKDGVVSLNKIFEHSRSKELAELYKKERFDPFFKETIIDRLIGPLSIDNILYYGIGRKE